MAYEALGNTLHDPSFVARAAIGFMEHRGSQQPLLDGVLAAGVSPDAALDVTVEFLIQGSKGSKALEHRASAGDFTVGFAVGESYLATTQGASNG